MTYPPRVDLLDDLCTPVPDTRGTNASQAVCAAIAVEVMRNRSHAPTEPERTKVYHYRPTPPKD